MSCNNLNDNNYNKITQVDNFNSIINSISNELIKFNDINNNKYKIKNLDYQLSSFKKHNEEIEKILMQLHNT